MTRVFHGTAVAIDGHAVLLTGASGAGKSDLALQLIDRGASLIGDDGVELIEHHGMLHVKCVATLNGKLEVRGIGILDFPHLPACALRLLVELGAEGERHPASWPKRDMAGWSLPCLCLDGHRVSDAIKVELALRSIIDAGLQPVRLVAPS